MKVMCGVDPEARNAKSAGAQTDANTPEAVGQIRSIAETIVADIFDEEKYRAE